MTDEEFERHPRSGPAHSGSHYQPSTRLAVLILALFIASLVAVFQYVNPISVAGQKSGTSSTSTTVPNSTATTIPISQVKVQVANGTSVAGLAGNFTSTLISRGWDALNQENGPATASTTVYYRVNFKWAASRVATTLGVAQSSLRPLGGLGAQVTGSATDDVVVLIGTNSIHG